MQVPTLQLAAAVFLGSLNLITNNIVRYTGLGIAACLGAIYAIYLKHPSTLLHQLEEVLEATDALIRRAKSQCPMHIDQISLAGNNLRLLQVTEAASLIKSRILDIQWLTWKTYLQFSKDIAELTNYVKNIDYAVQLIVEAEHQRKLAVEISQAQYILSAAPFNNQKNYVSGFQQNDWHEWLMIDVACLGKYAIHEL
ncbi:hypothetical protein FB451DRAFT_1165965 [Mycena latifolia]|nr:hypothetical protein FB451DRAFT_1165965 [Mycena latifolia]